MRLDPNQESYSLLEGNNDFGIMYQRNTRTEGTSLSHMTPWAFSDANYAEDSRDQKSTSSFTFMLAMDPLHGNQRSKPP